MASKNKKVLKLLFVSWFLFYAVSPLSYHLAQLEDTPAITKKTDRGANGLRLFLGELMWSKLFQQEKSKDSPENNRVIIKKARAISNSNNDFTKLKDGYAVPARNLHVFSSTLLSASTVKYPPLYHSSYYGKFSGLSPPFA